MGGLRRLDQSAIRSHFYPEGGWGWIVCACAFLAHVTTSGAQLSAGALHIVLANKFQDTTAHHWLGPVSWSVSSVFSPLVVNLCRRKNVRVLSLVGGILFPLSLFFTSFATELHQIFFSFGLIGGIGSCIVRESSGVVLGEYFRKRRQFVEQVVMAGTGVGVTLFSLLYLSCQRHIEWGVGFRIGAAFCTICILLPAFYRNAAQYQPPRGNHNHLNKGSRGVMESPKSPTSVLVPIGGDICQSLNLFCVPSLKPILWSAAFSSFGLYAPLFLLSDFGRTEKLTGGSLLLLQTHLGLGLSLGVILGAILTLKKFRCCQLSPRILCCATACLTGLSMIAISSVEGYYGYSLSAWIYGVALGSHLYTLKVLTMELTRTKHWSRIWSCVQSIMSPGILLGSGVTSYAGKPGFYACATFVLIGAGLIGFQLVDLSKCGSPQLSSVDNDSPIPPAPPPISPTRYGHPTPQLGIGGGGGYMGPSNLQQPGFYPLRRSISLQQPIYPCCREAGEFGYPYSTSNYSPYCRECVMSSPAGGYFLQGGMYPFSLSNMSRSYSLPQTGPVIDPLAHLLKTTGTQTNPNSPVSTPMSERRGGQGHRSSAYPGSYDRLPTLPGSFLPQDRVISDRREDSISTIGRGGFPGPSTSQGASSYKNTVMFASNPQLFPASATQSSATSTTDRSATPTLYGNHHHHHHHRNYNNNHTPRASPRSYYPQREERRSTYIKAQQKSFDSQQNFSTEEIQQPNIPGTSNSHNNHNQHPYFLQQPQQQLQQPLQPATKKFYPPSNAVVTVETHKKPGEIGQKGREKVGESQSHQQPRTTVGQGQIEGKQKQPQQSQGQQLQHQPQQQPAFTRHYFDSSKIQKGKGQASLQATIFPFSNLNASINNPQPPPHQPRPLPLQNINAKLKQYQQKQQPTASQKPGTSEFDWRAIQRQGRRSADPFENDPDPPYYPAAAAAVASSAAAAATSSNPIQSQPQPHNSNNSIEYTSVVLSKHLQLQGKVSSSEFDIEQPKFNSLRRPGTSTSSIGSQLNYPFSGTNYSNLTPVHQQFQPFQSPYYHHHHHQQHSHQQYYSHMAYHNNGNREPLSRPESGGSGLIPHTSQQQGNPRFRIGISGRINSSGSGSGFQGGVVADCPYCDPRMVAPPPLSLSVPALQQSDPHYMCHYGGPPPYLRRRNTWHHHRDQLEAITTSV